MSNLIPCPGCNNKIHEEAEHCPHCGYPLARKEEEKLQKSTNMWIVFLILAGYLLYRVFLS